jgi:hypothetical protein
MQYAAFYHGFHLSPFIGHMYYGPFAALKEVEYNFSAKLEGVMNTFNGVVLGNYVNGPKHAVAWNVKERRLYDPSGHYASPETFVIEAFHAVLPWRRGIT